ncbi:hypothetical protein OH687_32670 [Burkholderia anthina]|nr:hypothetical protein OH687_32670 [Burkholderia anthina]
MHGIAGLPCPASAAAAEYGCMIEAGDIPFPRPGQKISGTRFKKDERLPWAATRRPPVGLETAYRRRESPGATGYEFPDY